MQFLSKLMVTQSFRKQRQDHRRKKIKRSIDVYEYE